MASSYGAGKYGRAVGNDAIVVDGLFELQRALRETEIGVEREVQRRIKEIGEEVKGRAAEYVSHKTGRGSDTLSIEDGLRVATTLRGASIYTLAVHGGVQNVGGGPAMGWAMRGPHVKRAGASHYMDRAVKDSAPFVEAETEKVLDWIETTFQEG